MKEEQETLLDTLHQLAGCEYMSDLKSETQRDCLMRVITGMDISRYSADTWTKAASYLFQRDICFQTMDEVQTFLVTEKAKSERMEG